MHGIFLAVDITTSHIKPNSPHLVAVSGSGKGEEAEEIKEAKKIVEIDSETDEEQTNDKESEEEEKQKESQNEHQASKGSPVLPVSTDECKYKCIWYMVWPTYSHADVLLILV